MCPDDAPPLIDLYARFSCETVYQGLFTVMRRLPPERVRVFAIVDYEQWLALVAERRTDHALELIDVARYERSGEPSTAEIALVVVGVRPQSQGVMGAIRKWNSS